MQKTCCHCKKVKSEEEFNYKYKELGIRAKACKECTRQELKNHYQTHHQYYIDKANRRNRAQRKQNKIFIYEYLKGHPCVDCGENDPLVLEFDHLKNKRNSVAILARTNSIESLKKEILKCEVRCANCHRRKTAVQFNWLKMPL